MSAENWATCPQCKIENALRIAEMEAKVEEAYGVVHAEEYLSMRRAAEKAKVCKPEPSLAEYYTIGIDPQDKFFVNYHATCSVCGFDHKFEHNEQIEFEATEGTTK